MAKKISMDLIREVRDETGAPVLRVKKVLEETKGKKSEAIKVLKKEGHAKAAKRAGRETKQGIIASYVHHNNKVVGLVELLCETDFVARNDLFVATAQDLAMQVASIPAKDAKELEKQDFIKNPKRKVSDLVKDVIAKTGENVKIGRIHRMAIE